MTNEDVQAAIAPLRLDYKMPGWADGPWAAEIDGTGWVIASNGKVLLAVDRTRVPGEYPPAPGPALRIAEQGIRHEGAFDVLSARDLKQFAAIAKRPYCETCGNSHEIDCSACEGAGSDECECHCGDVHDVTCTECDGDGFTECPDCEPVTQRPAQFLKLVVSRDELALALCLADVAQDVLISTSATQILGGGTVYVLRSPDERPWWCAVLAPMRTTVTTVSFDDRSTVTTVSFDDRSTWAASEAIPATSGEGER